MPDQFIEFPANAAAIMPVMLGTGAICWWLGRKSGSFDLSRPFIASDIRTWPCLYTMGHFAIFALANWCTSFWLDGSLAACVGAFVAFGIVPMIAGAKYS
ncbi:MAG: hypothetical protein ABL894_00495 [Hyphomicrobium sp.]